MNAKHTPERTLHDIKLGDYVRFTTDGGAGWVVSAGHVYDVMFALTDVREALADAIRAIDPLTQAHTRSTCKTALALLGGA